MTEKKQKNWGTMSLDQILELEIDDLFFECGYGLCAQGKMMTKPVEVDGKIEWTAMVNGHETSYLITRNLSHYGPKIYYDPAYVSRVSGEIGFRYTTFDGDTVFEAFDLKESAN